VDRDFYVRQLRDWKFSAPIEALIPEGPDITPAGVTTGHPPLGRDGRMVRVGFPGG
jgi:hypothetical protein